MLNELVIYIVVFLVKTLRKFQSVENPMNRLCAHAVCQIIFHSVSTIRPNPAQLPLSPHSVDQIF